MKRNLILLGILVVFLCVGLSGCDQISNLFLTEKDKLLGTWNNDETWLEAPAVITFSKNGTLKLDVQMGSISFSNEGTWELKEGVLSMETEDLLPLTDFRYVFSEENTKLTLTQVDTNNSFIFIKQQPT